MRDDSPGRRPSTRRTHGRLSVPIGRIAGIPVRVHATFLLLVPLFAAASSGRDGPGPFAGLWWLVLVFACVVAHELAHSVVARRRGAVVTEILLLPIGGISKMERLPESPADEFAIAIVGPLTSIALAVVAAAGSVLVGQPLLPVDLLDGGFLARLAWLNLILGGFNLLPAFPLDGGRVFRALLERRLDLETATRRAARVGRALAVALAVVGILVDVWLVLIAVFVYFGASAEEVATIVHLRLRGRRVDEAMLVEPMLLDDGSRAGEARQVLRHTAQRTFPIVHAGRYVGVVDAQVLGAAPATTPLSAITDADAPTLTAGASLEDDALPLFERSRHDAVAVVRGDEVVGVLQRDDLAHLVQPSPSGEPDNDEERPWTPR
jgi:stage IV sporulation protein FB